jgi:hypothetical protein
MKLVVTLMVRDEVDIIAAMVEHHLDQGADLIIATDNGSVDGTTDVLQRYADAGAVELHHDPVHRKQQHAVVTQMARRAFTEFGADWVVNADADEFWAPQDKSLTLRSAFEQIPLDLDAFNVPVVNMVGPPALKGSGIDRLLWRDHRTAEQLQAIGIYAQPTDNAVHRGDPDVVVAQGNHFVSLRSNGQPDPAYALETFHVPWRSWEQFERKVVNTGRSYEANPDLKPSKNHHGMADWRRYVAGRLFYLFLLRQPLEADLVAGESDGSFERDPWLRDHLHGLADKATCPDLLAAVLDSSQDGALDAAEHRTDADLGRLLMELELERDAAVRRADEQQAAARRMANERDKARSTARPLPLRADWVRVSRRTAGAVKRRVRRFSPGSRAGKRSRQA